MLTTRRHILGDLPDEPQFSPHVGWREGTLLGALWGILNNIIVRGEASAMVWLLFMSLKDDVKFVNV